MNSVVLIGRITRDPEIRYTSGSQMAVATFSLAIDRPGKGDKKTDFPRVKAFGRTAENCETYLAKGMLVGVQGRLQTDSYKNQNGVVVNVTEVIAEKVDFLEWKEKKVSNSSQDATAASNDDVPSGFTALDEEIPF